MRWKAYGFADAALEWSTRFRTPHQSAPPTASPPGEAICAWGALRRGFRNPVSFIEIGIKSVAGRLGHDPALQKRLRNPTVGRSHDSADPLTITTRH